MRPDSGLRRLLPEEAGPRDVVPCPAFKYNIQQRLLMAYAIGRVTEVKPAAVVA